MKKIGFRPYRRQMEENLADKLNEQLKKELSGTDCSGMSEEELFSLPSSTPPKPSAAVTPTTPTGAPPCVCSSRTKPPSFS